MMLDKRKTSGVAKTHESGSVRHDWWSSVLNAEYYQSGDEWLATERFENMLNIGSAERFGSMAEVREPALTGTKNQEIQEERRQ